MTADVTQTHAEGHNHCLTNTHKSERLVVRGGRGGNARLSQTGVLRNGSKNGSGDACTAQELGHSPVVADESLLVWSRERGGGTGEAEHDEEGGQRKLQTRHHGSDGTDTRSHECHRVQLCNADGAVVAVRHSIRGRVPRANSIAGPVGEIHPFDTFTRVPTSLLHAHVITIQNDGGRAATYPPTA